MSYYSQHGEDLILDKIFQGKQKGFFVEVGCIDGKRFSNTLHFEKKGWSGICVEAHCDYIELLKKNRPASKVVHCAVGKEDKLEVDFFANSRGSLSTLDNSQEETFKEKYGEFFTGFRKQVVPMMSLNSIFNKYNVNEIDVLSLDIEGFEVEAMQGINLKKFYPKVLVIESDSTDHEGNLDKIILNHNYYKLLKVSQNVYYIRKDVNFDEKEIFRKHLFELIQTLHPLDKGKDIVVHSNLDLRRKKDSFFIKKVFRRVFNLQ